MIDFLSYHLRRIKEYTQRFIHTSTFSSTNQKEILWDLFVETNRFLADLEIDYWVNYGTLLGFHRENGIIGHDMDIDFGSREPDYKLIWDSRAKLNAGFTMHDSTSRHLGPKLYISYKGFDADVYFYNEKDQALHSYEKTHWKNYNEPIPDNLVFPLSEFSIENIKTFVPANTQKYLETIYGSLAKDAKRNPETHFWE